MTRPNIVRADTLDLQDQNTPTAAEHHKPALQNGLAPHQRAEVHHVLEERSTEEHALADAWNMSDDLTEEPENIDEAQHYHNIDDGQGANGVQSEGEDGEGGGSEADGDDDMMDRVSSSPSIDDGGYPFSSPSPVTPRDMKWPERKSSLSPSSRNTPTPTSSREAFNQSASSTPGSSPFVQTPQHLPLHVRRTGRVASPLASEMSASVSPSRSGRRRLPLIKVDRAIGTIPYASEHHQELGRYRPAMELDRDVQFLEVLHEDEGFHEEDETTIQLSAETHGFGNKPRDAHDDWGSERSVIVRNQDLEPVIEESPHRNAFAINQSNLAVPELEQSPSLTSMASVELQDVLLPVDDPLLDIPPSPTDSSGSWESLASDEAESLDQKHTKHDDDTDALFLDLDDRFIDSGWGGECLRETEDIDFEFVYALHTFVATVEGQANATKGDTMVLLDDSNSYWWLVRVVKDGSIGYLPAEHIETPTERLARLNKHRNIDLSATMLGDTSEKTRNPLKILGRRRNVKQVQFAAPTYVEASDYDYDDDEEDEVATKPATDGEDQKVEQNGEDSEDGQEAEEIAAEEEAPRASTPQRGSFDREQAATIIPITDDPQTSPKLVDKTEAAPLKSRKARNTDSFLKDDSIETRKITLTPGLLREEQNKAPSSESSRNDSFESLLKQVSPPEPVSKKDSKKEKEKKKDGMFRGLFKSKKKDKKTKDEAEQVDERPSGEFVRESPIISPLTSGRSSPGPDPSTAGTSPMEPTSPQEITSRSIPQPTRPEPSEPKSIDAVAELEGSGPAGEESSLAPPSVNTNVAQPDRSKESPLSPITNILKRDDSKTGKPAKAKRAKQRVELDDFDSPEDDHSPNPFDEQEARSVDEDADEEEDEQERLSDSPVEITPAPSMHGTESVHIPTPSPYDQPDVEDDDEEEPESMTSSPSIIEHPTGEPLEKSESATQEESDLTPKGSQSPRTAGSVADQSSSATQPTRNFSTDTTTTSSSNRLSPSTSMSQQSWSDSSLRAWLEDGSEVKDMMIMIHDKSDVVPVGDDHPMMAGLFTEQRKGVQDMMSQLDDLLGDYLQRKGIAFS